MNMTVAIIISAVIAFGVTAALGFVIIPWLRKLKFGQTILEIGPSWHKSKQGTPNMGGIMFIIGITIAVIVAAVAFVTLLVCSFARLLTGDILTTEIGITPKNYF